MASKFIKRFLNYFKRECNSFEKSNQGKHNIVYFFSCCGVEGELWAFKDDLEIIVTNYSDSAPYMLIEFKEGNELEIEIDVYGEHKIGGDFLKKWNQFVEKVADILYEAFPNATVYVTTTANTEDDWEFDDEDKNVVDRVIVEITK